MSSDIISKAQIKDKTIGIRVTPKDLKNITSTCKKFKISKSRLFGHLWSEYYKTIKDI